ncbi:YbfB/YjiJ family MFS transporter [Nitrincola tapanii]|uniref:YbfB/YjiJ family MFS transporter n=1 Tax=Nitrincola tapanii TaxID=1708751 RepID=A0A5A9VZ06_9GAMM|nr:YbfB/YjiJ family MFS transporter [Nitrincola tapanii]KAA0873760.1 YbfB/YjiJ family MFS transporter [Nitrincola tapanii]
MYRLQRFQVLLAGVFSQILCIGIARFAYTPLLPVMQAETWLGDAEGGWLAAINYSGYMCGALLAASISDLHLKDRLYRVGLILAIFSTLGMALADNFLLWSSMRFLAGLSSSASMLIASGLILNWLIRHNQRSELGIHFAGVGIGIIFAALAVEWMLRSQQSWDAQWFGLALIGGVLLLPAWRWLPRPDPFPSGQSSQTMADQPPTARFMWAMQAAYFCAGYGYVVSATFIVAIVERVPELQGQGTWVFAVLGLGAAPSVIIWDLVARRTGYLNALILAMLLKIVSILLPVWDTRAEMVFLSAFIFGVTSIGCVGLVLTMAGRLYPSRPAKLMGRMTLSYGVAQVFAPALTGILAARSGDYNLGLIIAGSVMCLGTLLILLLKLTDATAQRLDESSRAQRASLAVKN